MCSAFGNLREPLERKRRFEEASASCLQPATLSAVRCCTLVVVLWRHPLMACTARRGRTAASWRRQPSPLAPRDGCALGVLLASHISTRRRLGYLRRCLESIRRQSIPPEALYVSWHATDETLADETRSTAVVCSTICPGGIDTPWWSDAYPYGEEGASHAAGTTTHLIQPQELSDLLFFQLSMPTNRVFKRLV